MKTIITKKDNILVETYGDQRFYPTEDGQWLPSVTTIIGACYPKSQFLIDWQIEVGKEESEKIRDEAAEEGHAIHSMIETLLAGAVINSEDMTPKARKCIKSFLSWYEEVKPTVISTETQVYHYARKYAGTIDLVCEISGELTIIDFKTSNSVHDSYHAQIAAYADAYNSNKPNKLITKAGILHLNSKNKKGFGYYEVNLMKSSPVFEVCRQMFNLLYPEAQPKTSEYPLIFKI